ncbi:Phosphatidylinositol transfer protein 4 [Nosema granulosis]|uniref:Phosphatidylinositol transfer protein 4 n=1 Tax=Nosema granulosis TaxID=83296 RepID=A0A9P6H0G4_9MICR|nr:Phosphatidylinositol transfer protein 4 [Nosema granulosis]
MTKVERVYGFILPISSDEYVRGNKYSTIIKTLEDKKTGMLVELVERADEHHEHLGKVKKTVKNLHLHSRIPGIVKKVIPDNACIIKEISYSSSDRIRTIYHNNHFCKSLFSITIDTVTSSSISKNNPFDVEEIEYHNISLNHPQSSQESICYKHVSVEVNKYFLGWIAHEIDKHLRGVLVEHHENIVRKREDWINISQSDIEALEADAFNYKEN